MQAKGQGTLIFKLEDNNGIVNTIKLSGSLYVPVLLCLLLVPQHWSEQARDEKPLPDGTCAHFGNNSCKLFWDQRKYCKAIPYNDHTKMPTFFTAPGSIIYCAFNAVFEANDASVPYQRVLQLERSYLPQDQATFDPTKFVAVEDVNLQKKDQSEHKQSNPEQQLAGFARVPCQRSMSVAS